MEFVAKTIQGLEEALAKELNQLGADEVTIVKRAVKFTGDFDLLYRANYYCRTAIRILYKIDQAKIHSFQDLYDAILKIPWTDYFGLQNTISVDAVSNSRFFKNSMYVALKTKDAIVDNFRNRYKKRPDIDTLKPDVRIHVFINDRDLTVYLDSSGDALFKRNYRLGTTSASLNEVLAAGIISFMDIQDQDAILDPMCGAGTFLSEAYMQVNEIPAQVKRRHFCFNNWRDRDEDAWITILNAHKGPKPKTKKVHISGSDVDPDAVITAKENLQQLDSKNKIVIKQADFFDLKNEEEKSYHIIMNPPYDKRMPLQDSIKFYKEIGDHVKTYYKNSTAYIFSGNLEALKLFGLKPSKKVNLFNGPIPSKLQIYNLY